MKFSLPARVPALALLALLLAPAATIAAPARLVDEAVVKTWPDSVIVTLVFDGPVRYRRIPDSDGVGIVVDGARLTGAPVAKPIGKPPFDTLRMANGRDGTVRVTLHPGSGILLETGRRVTGRRTELQLFAYLPHPGVDFAALARAAERARAAGRPVVVLDPGHGGLDVGTSHSGILEKKINLSVARAAARALREHGGIHVVMTRNDDRYITLSRRRHEATLLGADLFLSFHVNANADPRCAGIEIYRPSGGASRDRAQSLLEDRENMSMPGDFPAAEVPDPTLAGILVDLKRERVMRDAALAAEALRRRLAPLAGDGATAKVKGGDFRVLNNLDAPSLLLELGFITNAADRALLCEPAWRTALGVAIAGAVLDHFGLPEPAPAPQETAGGRPFRIVRITAGDTVHSIARETGLPVAEVRRIVGGEPLIPGRSLVLPAR